MIQMQYKIICSLFTAVMVALPLGAETIGEYLSEVEISNPGLKIASVNADAVRAELSAENTLEPLSIEYSPFFRKGVGGVASSELIVQQEFDFPSLYKARGKEADARAQSALSEGKQSRREILLAAKTAYLDLVYARGMRKLAAERLDASENILALVGKQRDAGVTTSLDINRAEMEMMTAEAAFRRAEGEVSKAEKIASAFIPAGMKSPDYVSYPQLPVLLADNDSLVASLIDFDPVLQTGKCDILAEEEALKVASRSLLPKFAVGYRCNTEEKEVSNGFLVGINLPLYSGKGGVKAARARKAAKQLESETIRMQLHGELSGLNSECYFLQKALGAYDLDVMKESLKLMMKGVEMRHIPLQDYYTQTSVIYDKIEEYLELEHSLQLSVATLFSNTL